MAIFALLLIISCKPRKDLSEQLTESFANHLQKIDSLAALDSVQVLRKIPVTQRLSRIIDDSVYIREFVRVEVQLSSALHKNDKDSIAFYRYEINYMEKAIDSVTRSIAKGDTARKYGYLIGCAYYLKKNGKTKVDSTLVFIDTTSRIRYTEFMDSAIKRTVSMLN